MLAQEKTWLDGKRNRQGNGLPVFSSDFYCSEIWFYLRKSVSGLLGWLLRCLLRNLLGKAHLSLRAVAVADLLKWHMPPVNLFTSQHLAPCPVTVKILRKMCVGQMNFKNCEWILNLVTVHRQPTNMHSF